MIDISNDFHLKSYGRFADEMVPKELFKDRMFELSRLYKEIGATYLKHIGDDNKISGFEKKELITFLEKMLLILVMLRKIDFSPDQNEISIQKGEGLFQIHLKFGDNLNWEFNGMMLPKYKIKQRVFREWFNGPFSEDIRTLYAIYGNASLDKNLADRERSQISRQIDHLILEIIEMVVFIERFMLFQ